MSGPAFREDLADFVGPPALVFNNPVMDAGHIYPPVGTFRTNNIPGEVSRIYVPMCSGRQTKTSFAS
jgi:hypothetical protein